MIGYGKYGVLLFNHVFMDIPQQTASTPDSVPTKKPGTRFFRKFLYSVAAIVIILLLAGGYLGFIPGVSSVFGSDKPRDLGVSFTPEDEAAITDKLGITYSESPSSDQPAASLRISGSRNVETKFTEKELTALMAQHARLWKYYPITDAQVRLNADGTAELSGLLRLDRVYGYAAATGIDAASVEQVLDKVKIAVSAPPVYLKGRAEVKNGVLSVDLQKLEIGRLPVPVQLFTENSAAITAFAQSRLDAAHISVSQGSVSAGKVDFKGELPTSVSFGK